MKANSQKQRCLALRYDLHFNIMKLLNGKILKRVLCFFAKASLMTDLLFWCNISIYVEQLLRTDLFFRVKKFYIALRSKCRFCELEC